MEIVEGKIPENEASQTKAVTVCKYAREIRVNYRGPKHGQTIILDSQMVAAFVQKVLPDNSREHFVAVYLDGGHQTIGYAVISTGTADRCLVHPRELFQRAILLGAVAIVVGHNHPSGRTNPSSEDEKLTPLLKQAGEFLGIKLLDHVILGNGPHYSFAEMGRL